MAFRRKVQKKSKVTSIEELFEDYKNREVEGLLSHQSEVLKGYESVKDKRDIAIELPTGSGKTLVGLLIAEWRMRHFGEKVVFVTPTKQLVKQITSTSLKKYGLKTTPFIGSKHDYSVQSRNDYRMSNSIAVTSYSSIFNSKSFFSDADILIFDDAHAAENYVVKHWSFELNKEDSAGLFASLTLILKDYIDNTDYLKWGEFYNPSLADYWWVEKLPFPYLLKIKSDLVQLLDSEMQRLDAENSKKTDLSYAWDQVRNNLVGCQLFYSINKILIRPMIPPTEKHPVFLNSEQRVYMSATLGEGGDLERMLGKKKIEKIELPEIWEKRIVGRRLFYFSDMIFDNEKEEFIGKLIESSPRAVAISSSKGELNKFKKLVKPYCKKYEFISVDEFESNPATFLSETEKVLLLANRYDGLDFPGDECRLLILDNISTMFSLYERFMSSSMGASIVIRDRVRTRLVQAVGRCTRSRTDFALVVIVGPQITDLLYDKKYRKYYHPELQAEIKMGAEIGRAEGINIDELLENYELFLKHDEDWREVEVDIGTYREESEQEPIDGAKELEKSVKDEVEFQYNLLDGNYDKAFENVRNILSILKSPAVRSYRGFWNYQAGNIQFLLHKEESKKIGKAVTEYYKDAANAVTSIKWLNGLHNKFNETEKVEDNSADIEQVNNIVNQLETLGLKSNTRYNKFIQELKNYTFDGNAKAFENAQVKLGRLLGFNTGKREATGSPDPWWVLSEDKVIVFEDNSDADEESILHTSKARQAGSHKKWIKEYLSLGDEVEILQVLVTPKFEHDEGSLPHLKNNVVVWNLREYRDWVRSVLEVISGLRKTTDVEDLLWRIEIGKAIEYNSLTADLLFSSLKSQIYKG